MQLSGTMISIFFSVFASGHFCRSASSITRFLKSFNSIQKSRTVISMITRTKLTLRYEVTMLIQFKIQCKEHTCKFLFWTGAHKSSHNNYFKEGKEELPGISKAVLWSRVPVIVSDKIGNRSVTQGNPVLWNSQLNYATNSDSWTFPQ